MAGILDWIEDDEWSRLVMGRFSDADEAMMKRLVRSRATPAVMAKIIGIGARMERPGYRSSRPVTAGGGGTFQFHHKTVTRPYERNPSAARSYFRAPAAVARAAGAAWDPAVEVDGSPGAWWVPSSVAVPAGAVAAYSVRPGRSGLQEGRAARNHRYIERLLPGADRDEVEYATGVLGRNEAGFWEEAARVERPNGRVQSRVISELPFEDEIGPEGRARIVDGFGALFDLYGLPWRAAVHKPEAGTDGRNYHFHLLYHDRPAARRGEVWSFASTKSAETRRRGFVGDLRRHFASLVNAEYDRAGLARRWDPRTYEEMGIAKRPAKGAHLGAARMAAERKGIVTDAGRWVVAAENAWWLDRTNRDVAVRLGANAALAAVAHGEAGAAAATGASATRGQAARCGAAAAALLDAAEAEAVRFGRVAHARFRADELPRRAALFGEFGPRALRRVGKAVAVDAREAAAADRAAAEAAWGAAKAAVKAARREVVHEAQGLRAERMLAERADALAALAAVDAADARDRRVGEADWERRREDAEVAVAQAVKARAGALAAMETAIAGAVGASSAAEQVARAVDRRRRAEVEARLRALAAASREGSAAALAAFLAFVASDRALRAATGRRDRMAVAADDPARRSAVVVGEAEAAARRRKREEAVRRVTEIELKIESWPRAQALAVGRGVRLAYAAAARDAAAAKRARGERD